MQIAEGLEKGAPGAGRKVARVLVYEYRRHVFRRGFLFALLSVPLMVVLMGVVVVLLIGTQNRTRIVGYVDQSGAITLSPADRDSQSTSGVRILPFKAEEDGMAALEAGDIQVLFLLPLSYMEEGRVKAIFYENPGEIAEAEFRQFLRTRLIASQPEKIRERLSEGTVLNVRSADGTKEINEADWFNIFLPMLAGLAFIIAIFITSGYLMQAVVDEKENRTIEILVTSLSPSQLISGKVIGISLVGFTQLLIWLLGVVVLIVVGRGIFPWLAALRISLTDGFLLASIFVPAYLLVASLMAAIGATVTEAREGQQVTGIISLIVVIPYWFFGQMIDAPNSPLALALSFFPLTAPVTLSLRLGFASVPPVQLGLIIVVLVLSALLGLWLAGRAFRIGMLRYGKRLPLWIIFQPFKG